MPGKRKQGRDKRSGDENRRGNHLVDAEGDHFLRQFSIDFLTSSILNDGQQHFQKGDPVRLVNLRPDSMGTRKGRYLLRREKSDNCTHYEHGLL